MSKIEKKPLLILFEKHFRGTNVSMFPGVEIAQKTHRMALRVSRFSWNLAIKQHLQGRVLWRYTESIVNLSVWRTCGETRPKTVPAQKASSQLGLSQQIFVFASHSATSISTSDFFSFARNTSKRPICRYTSGRHPAVACPGGHWFGLLYKCTRRELVDVATIRGPLIWIRNTKLYKLANATDLIICLTKVFWEWILLGTYCLTADGC